MKSGRRDGTAPVIEFTEAGAAALRAARRVGLGVDDSIDCAARFIYELLVLVRLDGSSSRAGLVLGELGHRKHRLAACRPTGVGLWCDRPILYACAKKFALDHLRGIRCRREAGDLEECGVFRRADQLPGPEARVLQGYGRSIINSAILKLESSQQAVVFLKLSGAPISEIADLTNRTSHAVSQCLYSAIRKLRQLLAEDGHTERELRELLVPPQCAVS